LVIFYKYDQNDYIVLENARMLGVNKHINRTIMRGIKYLHPIEALHDLLLGARQPRPKLSTSEF